MLSGKSVQSSHAPVRFDYVKDLLHNPLYLLCVLNEVVGCSLYFMFTNIIFECLIKRFGFTFEEAKQVAFLLPFSTIFLIPCYSFYAVKKGRKAEMLVWGFVVATMSYAMMTMMPYSAQWMIYLPVMGLSQFWSIYCGVIISSISLSTTSRSTSLGFGLMFFSQNLATAGLPFYFGWLTSDGKVSGYQNSLYSLVVIGVIGVVTSFSLYKYDLASGGLLNFPENGEEVKLLKEKREI